MTNSANTNVISPNLDSTSNQPSNVHSVVVDKPGVGSIDHLAISKSLGYQIFRKTRRNAWTPDEDKNLKELLIEQYVRINKLPVYDHTIQINTKEIDWIDIASKMSTIRKAKECKKRWISSLDPFLKKGKWTKSEDEALIKAFKKHGASWQKVAGEITGRNEDQCSKRYTEVLNSDTKERLKPWSLDEDLILIDQVKKFGTKWRKISNFLPGRPSLTCRNRWRKIMTDVAKDSASDAIKKAVGVLDQNGNLMVKFTNSEDVSGSNSHNADTEDVSSKSIKSTPRTSANISPSPPEEIPITKLPSKKHSKSHLKKLNEPGQDQDHEQDHHHNHDNTSSTTTDSPNSTINSSKRRFESVQHTASKRSRLNEAPTESEFPRMTTPTRTSTDWKVSLVDSRTNEEMSSFTSKINSQEMAHYLIDLARFNGVNLTVHQHIHHHYSGMGSSAASDPQSNISRYGHFNYLPPLTEVPKLTSSSSPDNTVDSQNSNKNFSETSLLKLLNNEDKSKNSKPSPNSNSLNATPTDSSNRWKSLRSHRQQLYPSNSNLNGNSNSNSNTNANANANGNPNATVNSNSTSNPNSTSNSPSSFINSSKIRNSASNQVVSSNPSGKNNNMRSSKIRESHEMKSSGNNNTNNTNNTTSFMTEDLDEELDFWETMRSMSHTKINKPVSQHHPLHYYQQTNYKEQLPYEPSDSFGIQRFPNMATPLANMINSNSNDNEDNSTAATTTTTTTAANGSNLNGSVNTSSSNKIQTTITSINTDGGYGSVYMNNQDEEDEEDEDEANQYGMYYSIFANKMGNNNNSHHNGGANNNDNTNDNNDITRNGSGYNDGYNNHSHSSKASGLLNSGYLMPFNPS